MIPEVVRIAHPTSLFNARDICELAGLTNSSGLYHVVQRGAFPKHDLTLKKANFWRKDTIVKFLMEKG